jgi:hypothetical protein
LGGREFDERDDDTVFVDAGRFEFDAEDDVEDFLHFESSFGLLGPETILGRDELGEDDSLPDVFGGNIVRHCD